MYKFRYIVVVIPNADMLTTAKTNANEYSANHPKGEKKTSTQELECSRP